MMILPIGSPFAEYIAKHQDVYPEPMREEDPAEWSEILGSTPYSVGYFMDKTKTLVGWRVFKREAPKLIYAYDLTVLRECQRRGIGRELVRASLKLPRWHGETIHSHLRQTSYHIVASVSMLQAAGYEIISDKLIPDHYFHVYDGLIHEDAHELFVSPIGLSL